MPSKWLHLVATCGRSLGRHQASIEWQHILAGPSAFPEPGSLLANSPQTELDLAGHTAK